jgi:hypothetical protein
MNDLIAAEKIAQWQKLKARFRGVLNSRTNDRFSRKRLSAFLDLIFDALPDLVGAHVRIFQ